MAVGSGPPLRTARDRTWRLYDLTCAFAARLDVDALIPFVIRQCRQVFDAGAAAVLFLDEATQELYFPYVAEDDPAVAARLLASRFPAADGIAGAVLRTGRPLRVDEAQTDARFYRGVDARTGVQTHSVLAAPLSSRSGTIGVLQVINRSGGVPFTDEDLAFLEALAGSVAVAVDNARRYRELKASEERMRSEITALRSELARWQRSTEVVGTAPSMVEVLELVETAAASPSAVLLEGEAGTGKTLIARMIHRASPRGGDSFVTLNCAAFAQTPLESELFGHRRGAFPGATEDRRGLLEAAAGGTILLDAIGDLPLATQPKLLRAVQEGEITPLGDTHPRKVDVRVISTSDRDLAHAMREGRLRQDLYYRLAVLPIRLPPLRERAVDIPILADRFLAAAAARHGKRLPGIAPAALDCLVRFGWPGNVRQLANEMQRAAAAARDGETVEVGHLSPDLVPAASESRAMDAAGRETLQRARAAFEARYIAEVLRANGGDVAHTAEILAVSRSVLRRKLKEYGLR
jgi:Nif-specific regulatory protein